METKGEKTLYIDKFYNSDIYRDQIQPIACNTDETLYLSIIKGLFDNSIVAYKTGTEQNTNLVLKTHLIRILS